MDERRPSDDIPECNAIREAALEVEYLAQHMREAAKRLRGLPEVRRWNEIAGLGPSILGARDALDQLYDYLSALSADARIRLGGVARTRIAREESKVNPVRWRLILWSAVELAKRFFKKEKPKPVPCESEPELDEDESEAAAALRR